jgi:hypothetical protein
VPRCIVDHKVYCGTTIAFRSGVDRWKVLWVGTRLIGWGWVCVYEEGEGGV